VLVRVNILRRQTAHFLVPSHGSFSYLGIAQDCN
jgi:hypothetical protein